MACAAEMDSPPTGYRIGHCLDVLASVPDGAFNCCVTSPPYWGLRDYGDPGRDWPEVEYTPMPGCQPVTVPAMTAPLGLEPTVDAYVAHIVLVFREVARTLRDDGTLWLNLGDSYANDGKWGGSTGGKHVSALHGSSGNGRGKRATGLKPKDLVGIPWRVAFALQAEGWWLRSDNVWSKTNPMPESVTDRTTRSHEFVFMLTRSARYYYDADAVREPATHGNHAGRTVFDNTPPTPPGTSPHRGLRHAPDASAGRNRRTVWTVPTVPFPEAHFAVFPPDLARPCILAGCPEGGTVLDPFLGSGTTGMVAESLGRRWFGVEQCADYEPIIRKRTAQAGLIFAGGT